MKYCHACGKAIDDDILFCTYCGTRQDPPPSAASYAEPAGGPDAYDPQAYEPQGAAFAPEGYQPDPYRPEAYEQDAWQAPEGPKPPKKKKKLSRRKRKAMLKVGIAAGAAVLVIAVAAVLLLTGAIVSLLPHSKAKLKLAEVNLLKDAAAYAQTGLNQAEGLDMSYELTGKASSSGVSWGFSSTGGILENINKLKVYGGVESSQKGLKFRAAAEFKGNELLDALFFLDEDRASLYLSPILDDLYTCKLEELPRVLGMDEDAELPDSSKLRDTKQAKKDMEKAMTVAMKDLFRSNVKITKGKTVQLFDEEKTVKGVAIYQIKPTEKEWNKLLMDAYNAAAYRGSYLYNALDYFAELYDSDKDADELLEELQEELLDLAEELAENDVTIEIWMKGSTIIRQSVTTNDGDCVYGYDAYASDKESRFFLFSATGDEVQPIFDMTSSTSRGVTSFDADLYAYRGASISITGSDIKLKKTSTLGIPQGEYSINYMGLRMDLDVAPQGKGMDHTFKVSGAYLSFLGVNDVSVNLYTEKGASIKKPKGADTVDVGEMSEEELERLADKIEDKLEGTLGKLTK